MEVRPVPGLEQLPFAEVWFHAIDDAAWRDASDAARGLGKTGLEAWTTTRTPDVAAFLAERGYEEHRRYVISELDVAAAPDLGPPRVPLVTLAERPDLDRALYELARVAHADQPGREGTTFTFDEWTPWGRDGHPPEAHFIALERDGVIGYGYLEERDGTWKHGFTAVARAWRGRGVAGAVKRAQVAWAKTHGIATLETATEVRLAGMRDLNARFGYVPQYEEVVLRGPVAT
jgi:GNAT superfamily N-acetyltransferase